MDLSRLDDFARRHHGLVSRAAAERRGISRSAWYRAIASGQLEQIAPNVARLHGSLPTLAQRALTAVWAAGDGALASHRTAAALWGLERPDDDPIDIILPSRRRHALPTGVVIHRPRDLRSLRPVGRSGVPTTNPLRMLIDLGAVDPEAVEHAVIEAISLKLASPQAIRSTLLRHAKPGRRGSTALRMAIESWANEESPPDSVLETKMASLLREYRLPPADFHAMVEGFEVDFLIRGSRVVLECDGWSVHGVDRDQFEFDRLRDATLLAAGYVTVRFTWRHLRDRPELVARRIREVIGRWSPEIRTSRTKRRSGA